MPSDDIPDLLKFLGLFPNPDTAGFLANIFEDYRIELMMRSDYPALGELLDEQNAFHLSRRKSLLLYPLFGQAIECIGQIVLMNGLKEPVPESLEEIVEYGVGLARGIGLNSDVHDAIEAGARLYVFIDDRVGIPESRKKETLQHRRAEQRRRAGSSLNGEKGKQGAEPNPDSGLPEPYSPLMEPDKFDEMVGNFVNAAKKIGRKTGRNPKEVLSELKELYRRGVTPNDMLGLLDKLHGSSPLTRAMLDNAEESTANHNPVYPEWSIAINGYKPRWVGVNEVVLKDGDPNFWSSALEKYSLECRIASSVFRRMRPEGFRRLKGQSDGDELDLDAAVGYFVDRAAKASPSDQLYVKTRKTERSVAAAFLLDCSGSTEGEVLNTGKNTLVLLASGLEELGDSYGIFAFDSPIYFERSISFYIAKDFGEKLAAVKSRFESICAGGSTRIGAAVRHATHKLSQREEKTKVLILISDGRPSAVGYNYEQAIEDTRMSFLEARRSGIHPFCITIDESAPEYIGRMCGENYIILPSVRELPLKLPAFYSRITMP
ncbi:VWA domain-containing protein [Candidatus Woesearchaeota archaeon]|nr:VWA domain-containing protein [Candidatus Woesearchaeota archaeon]